VLHAPAGDGKRLPFALLIGHPLSAPGMQGAWWRFAGQIRPELGNGT
jgi:hypothetical protein